MMQKRARYQLKEIKLELTHRCQLRCTHCSSMAGAGAALEMDRDDVFRVIRDAADLGVDEIAFSGGEPLLWPWIKDAIDLAVEADMSVVVYSSGNVPDFNAAAGMMRRAGVAKTVFSLYAPDSTEHDKVTLVPGSQARTIDAIRQTRALGIEAEVHFVPLSTTYNQLAAVHALGVEAGAPKLSVLRLVPQGRASELCSEILDGQQNRKLRDAILSLRSSGASIRTGSPYNFLRLNSQPRCMAAKDRLTISPDMRIYPCDAFKQVRAEQIVGTAEASSLLDATLADCWDNSPYLNAVRRYLDSPFGEPCASCSTLDQCYSGCLAQKYISQGDLRKRPDPACMFSKVPDEDKADGHAPRNSTNPSERAR